MYLVLQSADLGRDTDDVEQILLETEWYVLILPQLFPPHDTANSAGLPMTWIYRRLPLPT